MGYYYPYMSRSNGMHDDFSIKRKRNSGLHPYFFSDNLGSCGEELYQPHNRFNQRCKQPGHSFKSPKEAGKVTQIPIYFADKQSKSVDHQDINNTLKSVNLQNVSNALKAKNCNESHSNNIQSEKESYHGACEINIPIGIEKDFKEELENNVTKIKNNVETNLAEIENILRNVNAINNEIDTLLNDNFQEKKILWFEELLTKYMIDLDKILAEGEEQIRCARKNVINKINQIFDKLAAKMNQTKNIVQEIEQVPNEFSDFDSTEENHLNSEQTTSSEVVEQDSNDIAEIKHLLSGIVTECCTNCGENS
ncbi:uncharacterized protein LOC136078238 [Hydra vulgaris]|uniref:Uncharacterized protein LOC136078238 n=1 Tax=Hydra vulgaris TaxID=6087 RepID=A0ABM4BKP2_HYDVU